MTAPSPDSHQSNPGVSWLGDRSARWWDRTLTDGQRVWQAQIDPWGQLLNESGPLQGDQPLRLPGQWQDEETGFHYNRFRYYDPQLGRYVTQDPVEKSDSENYSLYVENKPLLEIDPFGLFPGIGPNNQNAGPSFLTLTTFESAKRGVTLESATSAGALTRQVTMPAATVALSPNAIALMGSTVLTCTVPSSELIAVTRWGRPGLQSGDWIMKGGATPWNYLRSFKWQPGMGNQFTRFSAGETFMVPASRVGWPTGWGIDGWWKGLFGQRIYY